MSSRKGQVFMSEKGTFALVVSELTETCRPGSTVGAEGGKHDPDLPVYQIVIWDDSGMIWLKAERLERTLASWELEGHRLA